MIVPNDKWAERALTLEEVEEAMRQIQEKFPTILDLDIHWIASTHMGGKKKEAFGVWFEKQGASHKEGFEHGAFFDTVCQVNNLLQLLNLLYPEKKEAEDSPKP